jgi:hypothetical protein
MSYLVDVRLPSILQLVVDLPRDPLDRSPHCCIHGRGVLKHVDEGAAGLGEALQQYTDMSPRAIAAIGQATQGRGWLCRTRMKTCWGGICKHHVFLMWVSHLVCLA